MDSLVYGILYVNIFHKGDKIMKLNANVDALRMLVARTRTKGILVRFIVFCIVFFAVAPGFLRYPKVTLKLYLEHRASK